MVDATSMVNSKRMSMSFRRPPLISRSSFKTKINLSLSDINVDVLLLVLQYLNWPEDYYNLGLVSRSLYQCVMPELYRTVIITPNPRHTLRLLEKLDKDENTSASVQVLIFDNVVRSLRPRIPTAEEFGQARKKDLTDGPPSCSDDQRCDPYRLRLRLYHVLPKLKNLRTVCIKRWSHILQGPLSAAECYHYWEPSALNRTSILDKLPWRSHYSGPPPVMHGDRRPCPLDVVTFLLKRCTDLQKLYIVGTFPAIKFPNPINSFANLTVLVIGERTPSAQVWNGILRCCQSLEVFGLLGVHFRFEKLIAGCHFPRLESIGESYRCSKASGVDAELCFSQNGITTPSRAPVHENLRKHSQISSESTLRH